MRRTRLLMPVVAAFLGAGAGVAAALVVNDDRSGSPESFSDPLHLGVPLVDRECTGESLLVVGRGDSTPSLSVAVANNPGLHLRYLSTERSCDTLWGPEAQGSPAYVVYAGPFDTPAEPCTARMSPEHKGDTVTKLTAGNETFVKCLCELPVADFPDLTPGMAVDPGNGIWVRSLQGMLVDLDNQREADGEPPPYFTSADVTGVYDENTQERIRAYQPEQDISKELGSVRFDTWRALTDDACKLYEY